MTDLFAAARALNLFDANCFFGPVSRPQPGSFDTPEQLLAEMDRLGIAEALVYHADARWHSPARGNEALLAQVGGRARLHPSWVLLPPQTSGMPEPEALVEEMVSKGVRAARMFPREHTFCLSEWCLGSLVEKLEEARVPLFLDFDRRHWAEEIVPWEQVAGLCERHPRLPVVLVHESLGSVRNLFALMERYENLLVETSYFVPHHGIEEVCIRFGGNRLLFGTGMPLYEGGGPIGSLALSGTDEANKRLVGGENVRRLLGAVRR